VQNVGLMAKKAEEYGSHPTTFEVASPGTMQVMTDAGDVLLSHTVEAGDIWRMASTRAEAVENWLHLALDRQAKTGYETVFWLNEARAHDAQILKMLGALGAADKIKVMAPPAATRHAFAAITRGENVIAVTGNVLRDYLTDLYPILEVGTSAKMLSVVKLMNGGGLFETGAGGSAPKHVQQLMEENHLRWDSLGEFCALAESLRFAGDARNDDAIRVMGDAADTAITRLLSEGHSPGRKVGQDDNRDSHYHFALYWAEELAGQTGNPTLAATFAPLATALRDGYDTIRAELSAGRGGAVDLGGYYKTDPAKVRAVFRPSATLNAIIDAA